MESGSPALQDLAQLLPNEKLPIGVIAQMPFPLSMLAMRRFYNANWHKPEPDGETPCKWHVYVHYTYTETETWTFDAEAATPLEAKEKAKRAFKDEHRWNDAEIKDIEAEYVESEQ